MKLWIVVLISISLILAGCASPNPYEPGTPEYTMWERQESLNRQMQMMQMQNTMQHQQLHNQQMQNQMQQQFPVFPR